MNRYMILSLLILVCGCKKFEPSTSATKWADGNATGQLKGFAIIRDTIGSGLFRPRAGQAFPLDTFLQNKATRNFAGSPFGATAGPGFAGEAPPDDGSDDAPPEGYNPFDTRGLVSFLGGFNEDVAY